MNGGTRNANRVLTMWYLCIPVFLLLTDNVSTQLTSRIKGDLSALPGQFPYVVSIRMGDTHFSAGTIIHPRWVVTAAHPFQNVTPNLLADVRVIAGTIQSQGRTGNEYLVEYMTKLNYDPKKLTNDMALLRLNKDLTFNRLIQQISYGSIGIDKFVVAAGWGYNYDSAGKRLELSPRLKYAEMVTIQEDFYCKSNVYYLCAVSVGTETVCEGSSGGPLVDPATNTLVGIISMGTPHCQLGYATGFTRVSSYAEFIKKVIDGYKPIN